VTLPELLFSQPIN